MQHNQIPEANNNNAAVTIEINIENDNHGRPKAVTVRPVRRAGRRFDNLQNIFSRMAPALRRAALQHLRPQFLGRSDNQIKQSARGNLIMRNWNDVNRSISNTLLLADVNETAFDRLFESLLGSGSNNEITIYDVTWTFFINPAIYNVGGNTSFRPGKLRGMLGWDKQPKIHKDIIGCAALALCVSIEKVEKKFTTGHMPWYNCEPFAEWVMQTQISLGFDDPYRVSPFDLVRILSIYPEYRINVFFSFNERSIHELGAEFDPDNPKDIITYYDYKQQHFAAITGRTKFAESLKSSASICLDCGTFYKYNSNLKILTLAVRTCKCIDEKYQKKGKDYHKKTECLDCNMIYYGSKHECNQKACRLCNLRSPKDYNHHRCPHFIPESQMKRVFKDDPNPAFEPIIKRGQKQMELWVWDIESYFQLIDDMTDYYETNEYGHHTRNDLNMSVKKRQKLKHVPDYVIAMNVFTNEEKIFNDMESFIRFFAVQNNDGYNLMLAHNSSGYDSRLLFDVAAKFLTVKIKTIFNGTKLNRLQLGNCVFQDTRLHLPGSLSSLGRAFSLPTVKGHFPHLFSRGDCHTYSGPIPPIEDFDLTFTCQSEKDRQEFLEWYATQSSVVWNYLEQRELYCRNDVEMLKQIVRIYHEKFLESVPQHLRISPWFFTTMASHGCTLQSYNSNYGKDMETISPEQINEIASTSMCTLEAEEHYYARKALRGGMTNICKYIHEGKFHYQDIQSSYPSVQLDKANKYPVGWPTIEIHDEKWYPCTECYTSQTCIHSKDWKIRHEATAPRFKLNIVSVPQPIDINAYLASFFGIITVDITPPTTLYHPLIQEYNSKENKVIGSLYPISQTTIPSNTLHEALNVGYVVTKIYRADRYKSSESYWQDLLAQLYPNKMRNSGVVPLHLHAHMIDYFDKTFGIDCTDIASWVNNPVLKQVAKGIITSLWGKTGEGEHALSATHSADSFEGMVFYKELLENKHKISDIIFMEENTLFKYTDDDKRKRPNLTNKYVPAAVFVTAYGRIKLWKELVKLGTRVIMYDTDSIVYECNGDCSESYHIEEGVCLGQWETEKLETKNGGLCKFYALGPKSYSIICNNSTTSLKIKGATIKHAHANLINPEIMKANIISNRPGRNRKNIGLPQMTFRYKIGVGMVTEYFTKRIGFQEEHVKGTFNWDNYRAYPYGYTGPL